MHKTTRGDQPTRRSRPAHVNGRRPSSATPPRPSRGWGGPERRTRVPCVAYARGLLDQAISSRPGEKKTWPFSMIGKPSMPKDTPSHVYEQKECKTDPCPASDWGPSSRKRAWMRIFGAFPRTLQKAPFLPEVDSQESANIRTLKLLPGFAPLHPR